MRWRLVDKITDFEPWRSIGGRKAVSLEEYYLLQPVGREGVLPESLVLECCAELARWLAAASSGFERMAELGGVERFVFERQAVLGDVLHIDERVAELGDSGLSVECRVAAETGTVASGRLALSLVPVGSAFRPGELEELWREIDGAT